MKRPFLTAAAVVAMTATVAACSSSQPGAITSAGTQALEPQVRQVREAAANGGWLRLKSEVDQLNSLVEEQQAQGNVSARRAAAIEDAADVLLTDASPSPSPTPTFTTLSPTPTTVSPTPTTVSPTPTQTTPPPTTTSPSPTDTTLPNGKPTKQQKTTADRQVQPVTTTSTSDSPTASPTADAA